MEKIAVERIAKAVELFTAHLFTLSLVFIWRIMTTYLRYLIFHLSAYWIYITSVQFPIAHPASLFNNSSPY